MFLSLGQEELMELRLPTSARAAYIGLVNSTSNTLADVLYKSASGTMAHSWVQTFDSELEAFEAYCKIYPDNSLFN